MRQLARESAFVFASGVGHVRTRRYGEHGDLRTWRGLVLSASEVPLFEPASLHEQRFTGDRVRLIDGPARVSETLGIFERLPTDVSDPVAFAQAIEAGCAAHYGHAGPAFIKRFLAGRERWLRRIDRWREAFLVKAEVPSDAWERRFAARFALAYAAGRMAIKMGILPWKPAHFRSAIITCYRDANQGISNSPTRIVDAVSQVHEKLRTREGLLDLRTSKKYPADELRAAAGFLIMAGNDVLYAIKPVSFEAWCGSAGIARAVLDRLDKGGHLVRTGRRSPYKQMMLAGIKGRPGYACIRSGFVAPDKGLANT
jgi:hypothetical protein